MNARRDTNMDVSDARGDNESIGKDTTEVELVQNSSIEEHEAPQISPVKRLRLSPQSSLTLPVDMMDASLMIS